MSVIYIVFEIQLIKLTNVEFDRSTNKNKYTKAALQCTYINLIYIIYIWKVTAGTLDVVRILAMCTPRLLH